MRDIIALCNRDKEDYGIENDQKETAHKRDREVPAYVRT